MKRATRNKTTKTTKPKEYELTDGISQSILGEFVRCRVACRLMLERWQHPEPKRALQFGTLIHGLLAKWYENSSAETPRDQAQIFSDMAEKWERDAVEAGDSIAEVCGDLNAARAVFAGYCAHYAKKDAKKSWVEIEQVFDLPPLDLVRRRGKIDGAYRATNKKLWLFETKTASQISDDTMNQALAFDFQCLFYMQALREKLGELPVGVLYNVVRVPQIGKGIDRTTKEFFDLVAADIAKRPEFYFVRYELSFPASTVERFREELEQKLLDFKDWWHGELPTYRNESGCRGRWNCRWLPVCAAGGDPERAGFKRTARLFSELEDE